MGRAPCCDKANVKKGPWSPEEDAKLKSYIEHHGTGGNWIALPQKIGLKRCGKSCRLRWLNYLRPNIKHGGFSEEEDNIICSLYISIGSRWSIIAAQLPGRTDNDIKNYWNTRLKKKLLGKQRKDQQARIKANKQGIRKGSGSNSTVNVINNNQNPYLPDHLPYLSPPLVLPFPNQLLQPPFNDHTSLRKLLIKLGGRFSHDHHDTIQPINIHPQIFPLDQTANVVPSSGPTVLMSNMSSTTQFAPVVLDHHHHHHHHQYIDTENAVSFDQQMLQGDHNSSSRYSLELIEEMVYNNNHHHPQSRLDGLEFLYDQDGTALMNDFERNGGSSSCGDQGVSWGEISNNSMVYPPAANSDYGGVVRLQLQEMPQESLLFNNEFSYQSSH